LLSKNKGWTGSYEEFKEMISAPEQLPVYKLDLKDISGYTRPFQMVKQIVLENAEAREKMKTTLDLIKKR